MVADLEFDTPYIEEYLRITAADEGQEHKDLLWKYYARREEYLPAARALNDLATRDQ
jgi:nuclear pore complex protein Nup155